MSTSLGRLTLELAADPTQLNNDLNAVKAHSLQVAKDIEQALKNAFKSAGQGIPSPTGGSGGGGNNNNNPFGGLGQSVTNFANNIRNTFNSLKGLNLNNLFGNLKSSFQNIPNSARGAISTLPSILKAGVKGLPLILAAVGLEAGKRFGSAIASGAASGLDRLKNISVKAASNIKNLIASPIQGVRTALNTVGFGFFAQAGVSAFNTINQAVNAGIGVVKAFGGSVFETIKDFQSFEASLKTFIRDDSDRKKYIADLEKFAKTTPFELKDLQKAGQMNLATGGDYKKFTQDLQALGDVAAGANARLSDLANVYAKSRTEGVLQNMDIAQFELRGIPLRKELAKMLNASSGEIYELASNRKLDFTHLEQAFRNMSAEGGVFFDAMKNKAETLEGKLSNVGDSFYVFKKELGIALEPMFRLLIDIFGEMVNGLTNSKGVMAELKKESEDLAKYFKENPEIAKAVNKSLQDIVKGSIKGLINGVKTFTEFLKDNPKIIKDIATGISTVTKTIGKAVEFAVDLATTFGSAVINQINKNQDLINGIINTVKDIVKFAIDLANTFGGAVFEALNQNNFLTNSMRSLVESLIGLWNENKDVIAIVGEAIGSLLGTALKLCLDLVTGILNYLREHPAIIEAIGLGIKLVAKVFEGIVIAVSEILKGIGWVVEKVTEWANSSVPVQNFFTAVGTTVTGIITGMDNIIAKTFNWLKRLEPVARVLEWISNKANDGGTTQSAETGVGNITNAAQGMMGDATGKGGAPLLGKGYEALNQLGGELAQNQYFDPSSAEGRGRLAIALGIGGSEAFEKNTSRRAFYTYRGGTGNNMQGFGQFNRAYHANKIDTPDKYKTFFGEILAGKRALPNSQRGIGDYGAEVVKAVQSGRIKNGADLIRWMQQSKLGGSNWQGVDDGWKRNPGLADQLVAYIRGDGQTQAAPNFPESSSMGSSGGSGKTIQNQGLRIVGSSGEGNITSYEQLATHHHNSRGGGRRRKAGANREFGQSPTKAAGVLEEIRTRGVAGGTHIKKDFVLFDKAGNKKVPSPSPASGVVQAIFPGVGGVVIGDGKGNRLATSLHLSNIRVKVGDRVSYGQILGTQDGVSGYPVHSHVEMPLNDFRKYIKDLQSGRFGSKPEDSNATSTPPPNMDESGVGSTGESFDSYMAKAGAGSSGGSAPSPKATSSNSGGSSSISTKPSTANTSGGDFADTKRALLTARRKTQEQQYQEISKEVEFANRQASAAQKQQRELDDQKRQREREDTKARLQLQSAKAESPEAKQELERQLARFDIDAKYEDELIKLQRQREDLVKSRENKQKVTEEAKRRKEEFIANKKARGEEVKPEDLVKFDVSPNEGAMMDFTKSIASIDKMIEAQKQLKDLELQTLGISESVEDRRERRAKQRERDIEQIKREGAIEIDNLKKLAAVATDPEVKKAFEDKAAQKQIEIEAKIELLPIDDQIEDLELALKELTSAGLKADNPKVQEIQKQIDELNKQKQEISRKSGVDLSLLENERKQAQTERDREKEAENRELEHRNKIAALDEKLANARSDTERATLEFEKQQLDLLKQQSDEQKPLLDKLADLNKDRKILIDSGRVKEGSDEIKILDDAIANVNKQLELLKSESETAMRTLTKESGEAIEAAKRADAGRLIEKEQMLSGADVRSARIEQMKARNADPYKISAMERESALAEEALRYRQEMLAVEEKIASLKGTNAELTADEANTLRNNAAAMHEMNIEGINENVRTLSKDLTEIGKGAVADFFGQLKSGSMDFQSILQGIIDSLWNLGMELIQSELFGEGGIFGKKSKKSDDSGGNWIDGLFGEGSSKSGSFLGAGAGMGATPMQPAYVSVVGGAGGLGGMFGNGASGSGTDFVSSIFGGNLSFNKTNPLPIDMVSASKDAFSGLGDIFSGLFGGGGSGFGGGIANLVGGIFGGGSSGGGGGFAGGLLSFLPNLLGFAEGGKVQGININKLPMDNNPISKALRAESLASGQKPILAVLHEGELVLNREQQQRAGIFDVPRFDSGGIVGGTMNNFNKKNETTINMTFNGGDGSDTNGLDANALRAVINQEIIRQQGSGGSLGRGSYSRRGR